MTDGRRVDSVRETEQITEAVMGLPEDQRLELARRILVSVVGEDDSFGRIMEAVPGIEDVVTGKIRGLSEAEFRQALQ